jgi:alpha-tubulin suppressor-like RCC1 family protein
VPVPVVQTGVLAGKTVTSIAVAASSVCALASDGSVACWGADSNGEMGNGAATARVPAPVAASSMTGRTVTQITAGYDNFCALAGTVYCWCKDRYGDLGDHYIGAAGRVNAVPLLTAGTVLAGKTITSVVAGAYHTRAVTSDSTVACWGNNGQLGNGSQGTNVTVAVPVTIPGVPGTRTVRQLALGQYNTCVLLSDSTSDCWGYGAAGVLGNGTTTNLATPTPLPPTWSGISPTGIYLGDNGNTLFILAQ